LPLPLLPEFIVIQLAPGVADQVQAQGGVDTAIVLLPPAPENDWEPGTIGKAQLEVPNWLTVTVLPPALSVPVRAAMPLF